MIGSNLSKLCRGGFVLLCVWPFLLSALAQAQVPPPQPPGGSAHRSESAFKVEQPPEKSSFDQGLSVASWTSLGGVSQAAQTQTLFREDFEGGVGEWVIGGGTWEVGVPTSGPGAAYGGQRVAATNLSGDYPNDANISLISPSISLPASAASLRLSFRSWFITEENYDYVYVRITTDNGDNWTSLGRGGGDAREWSLENFDLTTYAGNTVRIAFQLTSDGSVTHEGWHVDDVVIVEESERLAEAESNDTAAQADPIEYGETYEIAAIDPAGDADYYTFFASAGDFIEVTLTSEDLDAAMTLYDGQGNFKQRADGRSTGTETLYFSVASAGAYHVRVAHSSNRQSFPNKRGQQEEQWQHAGSAAESNAALERSGTETGSYTLALNTAEPPVPFGLHAASGFEGVVPLDWYALATVAYYNVYRSTSAAGDYTLIGVSPRSDFVDEDVEEGQRYYYRVGAIYAEGLAESARSGESTVMVEPGTFDLSSPHTDKAPLVDGNIGSSEWEDAIEVNMTGYGEVPVTLYLKNNGNTLYIAVDDPNGTPEGFNSIGIYFDANNDNTWPPLAPSSEGNYWIDSSERPARVIFRGISGEYPTSVRTDDDIADPSGVSAEVSFAVGHAQYEAAINLEQSRLQAASGETIGLRFYSSTAKSRASWPGEAIYFAPSTFADVRLGGGGEAVSAEEEASVPEAFALGQNYPNPFNPATTIAYDLAAASDVRLVVHDLLGREVATLVDEHRVAGRYEVAFDASGLSSGTYLYTLRAGDFTQTRRLVLLK